MSIVIMWSGSIRMVSMAVTANMVVVLYLTHGMCTLEFLV